MEPRPAAPSGKATRKILWLSFLLAIVAYGVVGYLVFTAEARPSPVPSWLWPVLALFAGVAAFVVPSRIADAGPEADAAIRVPEILGWTLAETVAIVGLVSVALGAPRGPLAVYLVASALLLVFLRPHD